MSSAEWIPISICVDCTMAAANADFSGMDEDTERRVRLGLERLDGYVFVGDEEGYDEFSKSPCDCCGTPLHGSRQSAYIERHATA